MQPSDVSDTYRKPFHAITATAIFAHLLEVQQHNPVRRFLAQVPDTLGASSSRSPQETLDGPHVTRCIQGTNIIALLEACSCRVVDHTHYHGVSLQDIELMRAVKGGTRC